MSIAQPNVVKQNAAVVTPQRRFSWSMLVERLLVAPAKRVIGCVTNQDTLQYAQASLVASR